MRNPWRYFNLAPTINVLLCSFAIGMKNWYQDIFRRLIYPPTCIAESKLKGRLEGRVCLVTGASSGIGFALASRLIALGAEVILLSRHTEELEQLYGIESRVAIYPVDLRNREELLRTSSLIAERYPKIDYLFLNAGKSICRAIPETIERLHDYERTISVNYLGHVALLLALQPSLKRSGGRVIYSGSVSLLYPYAPKWSAYHASKGAMDIWLRTAKVEWHQEGIKVLTAYLPLVHTPMSGANATYRNLPGYTADEAAMKLLSLALSKVRTTYIPWWARITAPVARLLKTPIEWIYQRTNHAK